MAVETFIKFEKALATMADVRGACADPTLRDYFAINDFRFGAENKVAIGSATSGAGGGKVQFNEFTIRRTSDTASPYFFKNLAAGAHYKKVTLVMRKAGGTSDKAGKPFVVFNFGTVFTTKIDWAGPGEDGPEESITFAYGALDVAYVQQKPDGSMEMPRNVSWNQMTNKSEFVEGATPTITF